MEADAPKIPVNIFKAGDRFTVGPVFDRGGACRPLHSGTGIADHPHAARQCRPHGDWKIDAEPTLGADTDAAAFKRIGDEGVLALICDSTNATRPGISPTETAVSESLAEIISEAPGRVAITTFSSNVGRIRSIALAAKKAGRRVLLMGLSIRRVAEVSRGSGLSGRP